MINELAVGNFKAFGERQTARLAPITLVYGQNSSGKSSLLQGLLLLAQSLSREKEAVTLDARGAHVDLGSFHSFVHGHDRALPVTLGLSFTPSPDELRRAAFRPVPRERHDVEMVFGAEQAGGGTGAELTSLRFRNKSSAPELDCKLVRGTGPSTTDLFGWDDIGTHFEWGSPQDANAYIAHLRARFEQSASRVPGRDRERIAPDEWTIIEAAIRGARLVNWSGLPSRLIFPGRDRGVDGGKERFPLMYAQRTFQLFEGLSFFLLHVLNSLRYLGPLRTHPARHYIVQGGDIVSVGKAGENAPQLLHRHRAIQEQVSEWFRRFEIPYSLTVQDVGDEITGGLIAISLKDLRTGTLVAPSDVGFGIGQLLPVLVEGLLADSRTIAVEQPEIHLHPRLQAHLADFFIESSRSERGARRQWIVETHSEALVLRLQRRIREGRLKASDVAVLFVEHGQGGSRILELRLNDRGEFMDEWPGGFFEESYDEIFSSSAGRDDIPF